MTSVAWRRAVRPAASAARWVRTYSTKLEAAPERTTLYASMPDRVHIYELGPRDGLQNEPTIVDTATKIQFINMLSATGVSTVETTSFVHPKWVPQMSDHAEVLAGHDRVDGLTYPVLVPNLRGFNRAVEAGAQAIAVLSIPSETFARKNLNCSKEDSLESALAIVQASTAIGVPVRAYVSCSLGCPFEGRISTTSVARHVAALYEAGCFEVCIADTIGAGTPGDMDALLTELKPMVPPERLAVHCHDTSVAPPARGVRRRKRAARAWMHPAQPQSRPAPVLATPPPPPPPHPLPRPAPPPRCRYGQALANILCALQHGVRTVDSSVAGLGGCPFAGPAASGNVATEDVVYMLNGACPPCSSTPHPRLPASSTAARSPPRHPPNDRCAHDDRRARSADGGQL